MNKKINTILFIGLSIFMYWFFTQDDTNYTIGILFDNKHIEFIFYDWNNYTQD
jgi:hypothetical protein